MPHPRIWIAAALLAATGLAAALLPAVRMQAQVYLRDEVRELPPLPVYAVPPQEIVIGLDEPPPYARDLSLWYIEPPLPPHEFKVHDIVTILVDEKSEITLNSRFDRTRNNTFKSQLREFIRLGETGNLANAAENEPTIDFNQQARIQSTGRANESEGIRYRIGATIADVLPNGYLVLEARKSVHTNQDLWEYSLTGILRPDDVLPNNTALSDNIANLEIKKNQKGRVYSSTKLAWGQKLWDALWAF